MTYYDSYITSNDRKPSKHIQSLDDPDEIFELASVTAASWDEAIDINISECHASNTVQDDDRLEWYDMDVDVGDRLRLTR